MAIDPRREAAADASQPTTTVGKILKRLASTVAYRWVPLAALLLAAVALGLVLWFGWKQGWLPPDEDAKFLTISAGLIWLAALGGFIGSYVRILRNVVSGGYSQMTACTSVMVAFMRPVAGVGVGLFLMAVFASGVLAMPIGNPDTNAIGDIKKAEAFVFAIAFIGGLFDEAVFNLANRFIGQVGGQDESKVDVSSGDASR